jgi:serine/threonine protein phosphatase 1
VSAGPPTSVPLADGAPARLPAGMRAYAVGDIHGHVDLLETLYAEIRRDCAAARPERSVEIFLGDYVDRGPSSRDVVEWMISEPPACDERICLLGNHEDMMLRAFDDPDWMDNWLQNGGVETLRSYGVALPPSRRTTLAELQAELLGAVPAGHRAFMQALPRLVGLGGYAFVHAGVRPGVPLDAQDADDLVWIRGPFLSSNADFGKVVVHGHTPAEAPEVRPNRINLDTGAFFTGRLTCLVLDGAERRFLQTNPDGRA